MYAYAQKIIHFWLLVTTSLCNYQMRRKHLHLPNGSHPSKGEKVHLARSYQQVLSNKHFAHEQESWEEFKAGRKCSRQEKGPQQTRNKTGTKNSKFKSMKLHMLEQKEAPKEALHLSKKQNALTCCKTLPCGWILPKDSSMITSSLYKNTRTSSLLHSQNIFINW